MGPRALRIRTRTEVGVVVSDRGEGYQPHRCPAFCNFVSKGGTPFSKNENLKIFL